MGSAKASLEWHGSTLVRRVTGVLVRSVEGPVVVVSGPGQEPPALAAALEVVCDERPGGGPLQGLAAGALALPAPRVSVNREPMQAWKLGDVPARAGVVRAILNGRPVAPDPELTLVAGDVVTF